MLSLTPYCDIPTRCCKERRRNVAAVRRKALDKAKFGPPFTDEVAGRPPTKCMHSAHATDEQNPANIAACSPIHPACFGRWMVDNIGGPRLYIPSWVRRRLARWRVCEAPHCSHGDRASGHDLVAMFASPCRMCGLWRLRRMPKDTCSRRCRKVPGCLTGESEGRETWTAESLRAAFAIGKPIALRSWKRLRRSTF